VEQLTEPGRSGWHVEGECPPGRGKAERAVVARSEPLEHGEEAPFIPFQGLVKAGY
jgi:hypothetical protein